MTEPMIPLDVALMATIEHQMSPATFAGVERGPQAAANAVLRLLAPVFAELECAKLKLDRVESVLDGYYQNPIEVIRNIIEGGDM